MSGVVQDDKGVPLPGVTVTVSGDLLPEGRESVTDGSGRFVFLVVPPGTYRIAARLAGMIDVSVDAVIEVGRDTQIDLQMAPTPSETVTVVAAIVPSVDIKLTEVAENFTRQDFDQLPLTRSYAGLFELAPGVANSGTVSVNNTTNPNAGGSRQENTYLLDGISITNPAFGVLQQDVNELDIQEVNIKRGGISAEFGRTGGFVVNAVTKSGTNRFGGQARTELQPDSFIAESADPTLTTSYDLYVGAVGIGGPIVRDKMWAYGSGYTRRRADQHRVNRLGSVPDATIDADEYFAKITSAPDSQNFGTVSFRHRKATFANNQITALFHPSTASNDESDNKLLIASWTWFMGPAANVDVRYTHNRDINATEPVMPIALRSSPFNAARPDLMGFFRTTTTPPLLVGGANASGQRVGGNQLAVNDQNYFRHEIKGTVTWLKSIAGALHDFRFGFGYDRGSEDLTRVANGWGDITVSTAAGCGASQPCYRAIYQPPQSQQSLGFTYSLFAQDRFTIGSRTSVMAGFLFNRDTYVADGFQAPEQNIDTGSVDLVTFGFLDEIQPRLGVAVVPDTRVGDKVYANYGRYYNLDNRSFARAAAPRRISRADGFFDLTTGALISDAPRASESGKVILPGLEPTYTDEILAGYARPLSRSWTAEVWAMYRTTNDIIEDFPNPLGVLPNGTPCGLRNTSCRYAMGNLNGGPHDPATAIRKYRELTLQVDRRLHDGWSFNASYSWSKLYGNWDVDHVVTNNLQFFASSALHDGDGIFIDDPLRYGRLRGDRPHLLKLFATREIWRELSLGGYFRAQSGNAYQAVRDDTQGFDLRHLEAAGSRRTETWTNVDVLLQYGLSLGGARRVVLGGLIANLFDEQAVLFVDQRTHVGTFEQPTLRADPRRFVFTARVDF
jgi:hypothetical protein